MSGKVSNAVRLIMHAWVRICQNNELKTAGGHKEERLKTYHLLPSCRRTETHRAKFAWANWLLDHKRLQYLKGSITCDIMITFVRDERIQI
jgi:hypothetical protein